EHVLDPLRRPERALDVRAPLPRAHHREIAGLEVAEPLRLQHERHAGREVRLTDDELAAAPSLDDDGIAQTRRRRRIVRPEPTAPRPRPAPRSTSATSGNAIACT